MRRYTCRCQVDLTNSVRTIVFKEHTNSLPLGTGWECPVDEHTVVSSASRCQGVMPGTVLPAAEYSAGSYK